MSHKKARAAYEGRLKAWAAAHSPVLSVAYENAPFTPVAGETYLRANLLPAATDSATLDGAHRAYIGVFQVLVVAPLNTGPGAAETIADELAAHFVNNARLTVSGLAVQQFSPAAVALAIQTDAAYIVPVSWRYRADTT